MLTMSSAVKEWHEKMEQYKSQKDEILQKVQSLNEDLNGKGPKKKKPSKKEKEEIDKELFALNQELDVVEANIVEMGEPPATGQLKRKDKSKEPDLAPGAASTLDYRRSALLGYGDRNAAMALINNSEKRHSAPEPDKRKLVTPAVGRPTSVGAPVPNGIKVDKSTDTTPALSSPNQSAISPSPTTTATPAPPSLTPEEKKKDTPTHPEDEGEKSTSEGGSAGNNNNNEGKSGLSKKEERAKKKEEDKKKKAAKKASDKKKKEAADFVITRKD